MASRRVRQLEQRVESLIDLIAAKNTTSGTTDNDAPIQVVTPESSAPTVAAVPDSPKLQAPQHWTETSGYKSVYTPFDPVEAGFIDEEHACRLVEEFRTSFVPFFPFVVVDDNGKTLRKEQPFLFLAILAVTAHATPRIQFVLSEEMRRQLARIIEHARKSLEILQALLIYGAWYHAFFHPANQQLAIVVQLCVALVQDLGLSRNIRTKPGKWSVGDCAGSGRPKGTLAEKRAYLGTFFLNVLYVFFTRNAHHSLLTKTDSHKRGESVPLYPILDGWVNVAMRSMALLSLQTHSFALSCRPASFSAVSTPISVMTISKMRKSRAR